MIDKLKEKKVIGFKQTTKAIKADNCRKLYLAKDASNEILKNVEQLASENSIEIEYVDTMKQLGKLCGIQVGASTVAIVSQ